MSELPESTRLARTLLERAASDLVALRTLADHASGIDDIAGFHAQQAVEKSLKAALTLSGADAPRSHDLGYIVELVVDRGLEPPIDLNAAAALYPYAVDFRYASAPLDATLLVEDMRALAEAVVAWAARLIDPTSSTST